MRVLHVISSIDPRAGGTTTALVGMARAQRRAGIHVRVLSTFLEGAELSQARQLQSEGTPVELVGPAHGVLVRHPMLRAALEQHIRDADIVHVHTVWEEPQHQASRIAHRLKVPYVFSPHGMLDPWCLSQKRLKKMIYMALRLRGNLQRAAALHFTARQEAELVRPLGLRPPAIIEPLGIDLGEFASPPPAGAFRQRLGISDRPLVLFLSRLHPKKGLDLLIPVFKQVSEKYPDAVLALVGPCAPDYEPVVRELISRHSLGEKVMLTGMLYGPDRIAALADADLFVLPSYQENFGLAVVESLAAGTPVIISDQVNIHDQISEARVGAVVPTQIEPLAAALVEWLADAPGRRLAGERARELARQRYDWDQVGRNWVGHYQAVRPSSR